MSEFSDYRPERKTTESHSRLTRFIGKVAVVATAAVALGVGVVKHEADKNEMPLQERTHREYVIQSPQERIWTIAQRASPETRPDEASFDIGQAQPEGFDSREINVGDKIYLEPDASIGTLVNPNGGPETGSVEQG